MQSYTANAFIDDEDTGTVRSFETTVEMYDNGGGPGEPAHSSMPEINSDIIEIDEAGDEVGVLEFDDPAYELVKKDLLADSMSQFKEQERTGEPAGMAPRRKAPLERDPPDDKDAWLDAETGLDFQRAMERPWRS